MRENPITAELCFAAVRQNGHALGYVPRELKTAELCLEAVKQNNDAHQYVPEELFDKISRNI